MWRPTRSYSSTSAALSRQALIDCASIISGIIWKNKSSTTSIISIFFDFLQETLPEL